MRRELLKELLACRSEKRPVVLATNLKTGEEKLVEPARIKDGEGMDGELIKGAQEALLRDICTRIELDGETIFLQTFNPPLRMIVVGAVHIAQPLARMAALAGFEVVVVDPRSAFATDERFPGVVLCPEWPDEALTQLAPDARTAVITLTHDPKLDDPALEVALESRAFYIGSLGSRRTHSARIERLRELGLDEAVFDRICGPIGLSIGAKSPAEIAVAIMAQVVERLRKDS